MSEKGYWFTGQTARVCDCGIFGQGGDVADPKHVKSCLEHVKPCLDVYTEGKTLFAYCDVCDRTWEKGPKGGWSVVVK